MRWERLFADLEHEFESAQAAELEAEIADRIRAERARLQLVDRVRGSFGSQISVLLLGAGQVTGEVRGTGPDWFLLRGPGGQDGHDHLVLVPAVLEVRGLSATSVAADTAGPVAARFGLSAVLRGLARDRVVVTATLVDGGSRTGVIEVVGADLVELSERDVDDPAVTRAASRSGGRSCLPTRAIALIRPR